MFSRFWNMCCMHGLTALCDGPPELNLTLVADNIRWTCEYLSGVRCRHIDPTNDWSRKLADLGHTAVMIMQETRNTDTSEAVRRLLMPLVLQLVGVVTTVGGSRPLTQAAGTEKPDEADKYRQ